MLVLFGSPPLSCAEDLYLCSASVRGLDKKGLSVMDKDETVSAAFLLVFTNDVLGNFFKY